MKNHYSIEQQLIATRQQDRWDERFTDSVMQSLPSVKYIRSPARRKDSNIIRRYITMKLHHASFATLALIVTLAIATITGTAYASYRLWTMPRSDLTSVKTGASGRTQANFVTEFCGNGPTDKRFELKKNATITEKDIPRIVAAQCELEAISEWGYRTAPDEYKTHGPVPDSESATNSGSLMVRTVNAFPFIQKIKAVKGDVVTLTDPQGDNELHYTISEDTVFVKRGQSVERTALESFDHVVIVSYETQTYEQPEDCRYSEDCPYTDLVESDSKLGAVVGLTYPIEDYDYKASASLTELTKCPGLESEWCKNGGGIDIYEGQPSVAGAASHHQLDGKIVSLTPSQFVLEGSSGTLYTVHTQNDPIGTFNLTRSSDYEGLVIGEGDYLSMEFYSDDKLTDIAWTNVASVQVSLEVNSRTDPLRKYN